MKFCLILLMILLSGCHTESKQKLILCEEAAIIDKHEKISFKELYAAENTIDGKDIILEGFFSLYFEDISLYPSKHNRNQKGVWLSFSDYMMDQDSMLIKLNGKKIEIAGTIDLSRKGHLGAYFCTITNIVCVSEK